MKLTGKTTQELLAMRDAIQNIPENRSEESLYKYNKRTRMKLDEIDRQIAFNLLQAKKAKGVYVNEAGYSGRQCKR